MQTEPTTSPVDTKSLLNKEEFAGFYKHSLPEMVKVFFSRPTSGTFSLLTNRSDKSHFQSLVLMASVTLLYILFSYVLMPAQIRELIGFSGSVKIGIVVLLFMLLVSVIAFALKSLTGKADLKNELMTGGLCAIPLTVLLVLIVAARLFMDEESLYSLSGDPSGLVGKSVIWAVLALYVLLMLINIFGQSLKAGGAKDSLAWYLSPLGILLSFYISGKIGVMLF